MKTYLRHRIWNVVEVKELIALEYLDFEGKYSNYSEQHDFFELCFVSKGEIVATRDGEQTSLQAGDLLVIPPSSVHSYTSACGNAAKAFVVCFESSSQALRPLAGVRFLSDETVCNCMRYIIEESANTFRMDENEHLAPLDEPNFGGQQAIMLQLEYLLICLVRRLSMQENSAVVFLKGDHFYSDLSKAVLAFFKEHIREPLTLNDVCTKMSYSRSFLCKTFKKQTGQTLMDCFHRMKIREAERMLVETGHSLKEIAAYLGFSDTKHFGVLFKKYAGDSPSVYRKRNTMGDSV